ncbi:MAG TPA: NAD(+)/NADH kinase [Steroidobacteraceae bacterium]|jgi:NAD+ kinase|nr:NAD(+)/NADH kinase [Steroidobacteraceae bacterium]
MAFPVRACALIGRFTDPQVAEPLSVLVPHLAARQITVLVGPETPLPAAMPGIVRVPSHELVARADLVIAIGGDGTLLYAAGLVARHDVPLLGINRGRLGFLTDVMPAQLVAEVDAALQGRLMQDQRPLLAARLERAGGVIAEALALNDVVLQRLATGRMVDVESHIDGRFVNTHAGDGVVIASATGSTGYALSCGGPIVEPHLDVFVVAPICPHTLSNRPIVVSAHVTIGIQLLDRHDTRAQVVCDGVVLGEITPGDRLSVKQASEHVTLLHPVGHDYYRLLRSKLHWGHGSHDHSR